MALDAKKALEDLNLSNDEVERLANAFKQEEFRKLFKEYADEISDPENRKRYEEEIQQLENERGMDVQFVNPVPGYVIKTSYNGQEKAFINICTNEHIEKPVSRRQVGPEGRTGLSWSIPHSFSPPRDDVDKLSKKCKVFDFVVHPDTYRMAESNVRFKNMIHDTAFDGIERQFDVNLDRKNLKFPKMKFKGTPTATVIRKKTKEGPKTKESIPDDIMNSFPYPYDQNSSEEKAALNEENARKREQLRKDKAAKTSKISDDKHDEEFTKPKYIIKHRSDMDFQDFTNASDAGTNLTPKDLVVEVDLPLLMSAASVDLNIFERKLTLQSIEPAKYKLELSLPYSVDENNGSAKFDKSKRKLCVTLPVIPCKEPEKVPLIDNRENENVDDGEEQIFNDIPVLNGTNNDSKPLIEVMASSSTGDNNADEEAVATDDMSTVDCPIEQEIARSQASDTGLTYTLPSFDFHQDDETISIIVHAGSVERSSARLTHPTQSTCIIQMSSIGSGGFPINYRLELHFPVYCTLEVENCRTDVDAHNVVIVLVKTDGAIGVWERFEAGLSEDTLQEKLFLTRGNLKKQLSGITQDDAEVLEQPPSIEVAEMDKDKLVVNFKQSRGRRRKKRLSESADDFEVVYKQEVPPLRSIIKSRSVSESSDDIYASGQHTSSDDIYSYLRQNSATGGSDSSLADSDENSEGLTRKKTVSFSEHIDSATYKSNQSVSSMKATLKNRRRKQRKAEQKYNDRHHRRRRKSSGSECCSSDDMTIPGTSDDMTTPGTSDDMTASGTSEATNTPPQESGTVASVVEAETDISLLAVPDTVHYDVDGDDEASPTVDKPDNQIKMRHVTNAQDLTNRTIDTCTMSAAPIIHDPTVVSPTVPASVIAGKQAQLTHPTADIKAAVSSTVSPSNSTVSPSNSTVSPSNSTVSPSNSTVSPSNNKVSPSNGIMSPSNNKVFPSNDTVSHSNDTVSPSNSTVSPSNNAVSLRERTKDPEVQCLDSDDGEDLDALNQTKQMDLTATNQTTASSLIQELDPEHMRNREGVVETRNSQDSSLCWQEQPSQAEHSTKCAFDFSNSVVFDLDID